MLPNLRLLLTAVPFLNGCFAKLYLSLPSNLQHIRDVCIIFNLKVFVYVCAALLIPCIFLITVGPRNLWQSRSFIVSFLFPSACSFSLTCLRVSFPSYFLFVFLLVSMVPRLLLLLLLPHDLQPLKGNKTQYTINK